LNLLDEPLTVSQLTLNKENLNKTKEKSSKNRNRFGKTEIFNLIQFLMSFVNFLVENDFDENKENNEEISLNELLGPY
jgi:hypothetical protein